MNILLKSIHWIILLYVGFEFYTKFEAHQEELETSKFEIPGIQNQIKKKKKEKKTA